MRIDADDSPQEADRRLSSARHAGKGRSATGAEAGSSDPPAGSTVIPSADTVELALGPAGGGSGTATRAGVTPP